MVTVRRPHVHGSFDTSGPAMSTQGQRAHDALALHRDTVRERLEAEGVQFLGEAVDMRHHLWEPPTEA